MAIIINKDLDIKRLKESNINYILKPTKEPIYSKNRLNILILNLMPKKQESEFDLLKCFPSKNDYDIDFTFLKLQTHKYKNTNISYLDDNYLSFEDIKDLNFDGFIMTGAPIEHLDFLDIYYFDELKKIFSYVKNHIKSRIYICWAAQAFLYNEFNVDKKLKDDKIFGFFKHFIHNSFLFDGINDINLDEFYIPHSRYSYNLNIDLKNIKNLNIIAQSNSVADIAIAEINNYKDILFFGHLEYDNLTILNEFIRDIDAKKNINIPSNYFVDNFVDKSSKKTVDKIKNLKNNNSYTHVNNILKKYIINYNHLKYNKIIYKNWIEFLKE